MNVPTFNIKEACKCFTLFFISLSNRLRITNYCLKSLSLNSQDLFKETILGTYEVRNEIETKRNETKRNEINENDTKWNETKRNEINEM
jgi:hypothetical protein